MSGWCGRCGLALIGAEGTSGGTSVGGATDVGGATVVGGGGSGGAPYGCTTSLGSGGAIVVDGGLDRSSPHALSVDNAATVVARNAKSAARPSRVEGSSERSGVGASAASQNGQMRSLLRT